MNFIDLQAQYGRYKSEIDEEIQRVLSSAQFIMGPAVGELEKALAVHVGVPHAIGCSSGTDALVLALMAYGVRPGDEIIVPDFTFFATAEVVAFLGATPVFVDVREDTFNIDPALIERRITARTRGIIPVSLFGQCADFAEIQEIGRRRKLWVLEDAAQSYGATYKGSRSCGLTDVASTSFFPAKPLGCYGDGGAIFTRNDSLAASIRVLLNHGQSERYKHATIGMNGRLDTLQAAVLKVKLRHFDDEMVLRQRAADRYAAGLDGCVTLPTVLPGNRSVWAQYTVRSRSRDAIAAHLKEKGIPTAIHYPIPLHRQEAFSSLGLTDADFPVSSRVAREVFSLPMHPFLSDEDVDRTTQAVREAVA
jgi:UDP-2-acetamido-2-deoxy-ribo-hexuluronate aminotransferase